MLGEQPGVETRTEGTTDMHPLTDADRAIMLLPYEEWISVDAAAQQTKIGTQATARVLREGRRRGVLRTRGKGAAQEVMRIHPGPRRPSRRLERVQK
ncbi:hypothetical protein U9R90_26550 [Streptomyces sp. E11-3]|uniref:hypothetical protein n=1 Tax=Streptomyces sp. E11-3 TaxID=3110112 RepID=UPI00397FF493